tara:strand:+ start:1571 stop:1759 length:189 start_codon:yes stop_codon:yes gene_type:complete
MEDNFFKPIKETRTLLDADFYPTLEPKEAVYESITNYDENGELIDTKLLIIKKTKNSLVEET